MARRRAPATATTAPSPRPSTAFTKPRSFIIHRRGPWKSLQAVEFATLEWFDWFNHRRLLEPIGNIPPAEAEQRYFAAIDQMQIVSWFNPNRVR